MMLLEGDVFGHYKFLQRIGSGGMGEVYLAEDMRIDRRVAVKVVHSEPAPYPNAPITQEATRLFQREMKAIASLDHPNILPLLDFGEQTINGATYTYLVMPYRPEGSLVNWLHRQGGTLLPLQDVVHIVLQVAEALQHAHHHQVVHLDVKASNFLIRDREGRGQLPDLLLADFGIARFSTATSTASQSIRGTPSSMAPEQWAGHPVAASDQYALAIMAYQLLTGTSPFQGSMQQMMYQHLHESPRPPSAHNAGISASIDTVLLCALAKRPEDRFPSILAFAAAFQTACQGERDSNSHEEHEIPATILVSSLLPATARVRPTSQTLAISPTSGYVLQQQTNQYTENMPTPSQPLPKVLQSSPPFAKQGISRRTFALGMIGMAAFAVAGSAIVWWETSPRATTSSQRAQTVVSRSSNQTTPTMSSSKKTTNSQTPTEPPTTSPTQSGKAPSSQSSDYVLGTTIYVYRRHTDQVTACTWSPDGSSVATGSEIHS